MLTESNKCSLFSTSGVPSVNKIDLWALILAGPTGTSLVLYPLAVLHLDNSLYISRLQNFLAEVQASLALTNLKPFNLALLLVIVCCYCFATLGNLLLFINFYALCDGIKPKICPYLTRQNTHTHTAAFIIIYLEKCWPIVWDSFVDFPDNISLVLIPTRCLWIKEQK